MLRFLADIHISPRTVKALQSEGYDIVRITEFLPATATDRRIVEFVAEEGYVIVTQDLDFSALVVKRGESRPSVLSLPPPFNAPPGRVGMEEAIELFSFFPAPSRRAGSLTC